MYGVARKSADILRISLVTTAAMLAICLLALVETTNMAEAEDSLPQNGKIAFTSFHSQDQDYAIYTVDPDGSSLRPLTHKVANLDIQSAWSPDGTKIAFESPESIWVMGADGSNLRRLTPKRSDVSYSDPAWSPDGTTLAFGIDNDPSKFGNDLYTMDVDGSNKTRITNSPKIYESSIDISPDGSQMCLYRNEKIYLMNVDGSTLTRLTTEGEHAMDCSWSPDGTKIAYSVAPWGLAGGRDLGDAEVYIMNADGSGKTKLTNTPEGSGGPAGAGSLSPEWAPDGAKIAFTKFAVTSDGNGDFDIYTMDTDGSNVTPVTTNPDADETYADWQPLIPKSRSITVHQPDTGGPSLLLIASVLLFTVGSLLYTVIQRSM